MAEATLEVDPSQPKSDTLTRRMKERAQWDAWWQVMDIETQGNLLKRLRYFGWRIFDAPVTWWRENVIEPIHDKNKWPYYHQKFGRVRDVDQCPIGDNVCVYEANWQFRLDKLVDTQILSILRKRLENCDEYYYKDLRRCTEVIEDAEEAELNYYIKYGELGIYADSLDCYMKQKHRMVWERRHPKLMEMRQKAYQEHKEKIKKGIYDLWFWKRAYYFQWKKTTTSTAKNVNQERSILARENVSQNPLYYKEQAEKKARGEYMHPSEEYNWYDSFP